MQSGNIHTAYGGYNIAAVKVMKVITSGAASYITWPIHKIDSDLAIVEKNG